jgi:hypothetical protein
MDAVSKNMIAEIIKIAEVKLGRKLTKSEVENISKPRSYIGFESILDYLKSIGLNHLAVEKYLKDI